MQCSLEECDKEIVGRQRTAKYCSIRCGNLARYRRCGRASRQNKQRLRKLAKGQKHCKVCLKLLAGKQRDYCSNQCKAKKHSSYPQQKERGVARKLELIHQMGGGCSSKTCPVPGGYSRNITALTFHHRNPEEKSFPLDARSLSCRSMEAILAEAAKCELLCHLCHQEHHHPNMEMALQLRLQGQDGTPGT